MVKVVEKTKKCTKEQVDMLIADILALKEQKKQVEKKLGESLKRLEGMYREEPETTEIISGNDYEAIKIPKDLGKNKFNPIIVKAYLEAIDPTQTADIIKVVQEVDAKKFNKLVENGYITPEMRDAARMSKWTFSTQCQKKETALVAEVNQMRE